MTQIGQGDGGSDGEQHGARGGESAARPAERVPHSDVQGNVQKIDLLLGIVIPLSERHWSKVLPAILFRIWLKFGDTGPLNKIDRPKPAAVLMSWHRCVFAAADADDAGRAPPRDGVVATPARPRRGRAVPVAAHRAEVAAGWRRRRGR